MATVLERGVGRDEVSLTYALARERSPESAQEQTATDSTTTADVSGDPREVEEGSNLVPRTTTVPGEWYDGVELAFRLRDELVETYLDAIVDIFVVPEGLQQGATSLSLTATAEDVRDAVVDHGRDVDLGVDARLVEELPTEDEHDADLGDARRVDDADEFGVPGGVVCATGGSLGTLTPAMYDAGTGSQWFGTSNHVYGDQGTNADEHVGELLYVLDETDDVQEIGAVHRGYPSEDVGQIRPTRGYRPTSRIDGASPSAVVGQFTRYGLALLAARGRTLEKVGAFSGHTTGEIEAVDGITCYAGRVCKAGQLKWGDRNTITSGDSGSVNYHPDLERPAEGVLVGGINNARTWWPGDFAWGTAAHHLLETRGLHF